MLAMVASAAWLVVWEIETSTLQARLLSRYAPRLSYSVGPGPSPRILFPRGGPFDVRLGYSRIPDLAARLERQGYRIAEQARLSPELEQLMRWGVAPPYREPASTGLTIRSAPGSLLYDAAASGQRFGHFEEIPPIVAAALLLIENRELADPPHPQRNPAVEWDRLMKASLIYAGSKLGFRTPMEGGSTLATQIEKFRHSERGRTHGVADKLRQMTAASLKAYRHGTDTRPWRREIVVDYLNTMPLAAAPGYGEVYGLGDGLYAWFGMNLDAVCEALRSEESPLARVHALKHVLALLAALPAPSAYLMHDRDALADRVDRITSLLSNAGVLPAELADAVEAAPILFVPAAPSPLRAPFPTRKAPNAVRASLARQLGIHSLYELDRLHLEVESTIDPFLQEEASKLLAQLGDPGFVVASGLRNERLLRDGDPRRVTYSLLLFERTPEGNRLRVHADNLDRPFDLNRGMKLELGSTAKLRTLAHYLELVAWLHAELSSLDRRTLSQRARSARDPITRWVAETLARERGVDLERLLERALERRYPASPYEVFFTAGGVHTFRNFDRDDDGRTPTVRDALRSSTNLVFIRLMRDLVRYHQARLPYDTRAVLADPSSPDRRRLLEQVADAEATEALERSHRTYRGLAPKEAIARLLGRDAVSPRHLAILFFAGHPGAAVEELSRWLVERGAARIEDSGRLFAAYGNPRLTLADYGFLLRRHPLEVWCVTELLRRPELSREELLERSGEARRIASTWLFKTRHRGAQDARLRARIERDAFERMTPFWQRLGFPFARLVPSYATAIGNSSDRPAALADLMGVIVNDGVRLPAIEVSRLHFASGTPYETVFDGATSGGERLMQPAVARALRGALAGVVASGTARRLAGAIASPDGTPIVVGGKTGSGDNRYKTFNRYGGVISSRAVNRTATFVFYIADRYFGVITASVAGHEAERYSFTSALPVTALKLLAPAINRRLAGDGPGLEPLMTAGSRGAQRTGS